MSILDFIKNRQFQQQAPASQVQPETAKQMYTREAEAQKQRPKLQDALAPEQLAKARQVQRADITGGQDVSALNVAASPIPSGSTANPQPMRQMSKQQGNPAPSLSPTSAQMGTTGPEKEHPSPDRSPTPKPTLPRATPSWER